MAVFVRLVVRVRAVSAVPVLPGDHERSSARDKDAIFLSSSCFNFSTSSADRNVKTFSVENKIKSTLFRVPSNTEKQWRGVNVSPNRGNQVVNDLTDTNELNNRIILLRVFYSIENQSAWSNYK